MQSLTTTFLKSKKLARQNSKKNGRIYIQTAKMENKPSNKGKMSNKQCIKARVQYLQRGYKASEATSRAACFALL